MLKGLTEHYRYRLVAGFMVSVLAGFAGKASYADGATRLEKIDVQANEEPMAEMPPGIGVSGKIMSNTPGYGGDPLRSAQSVHQLLRPLPGQSLL